MGISKARTHLSAEQVSHFRHLTFTDWEQTLSFTFFGEKFLGIFSCHNELARHLPQKFYDQGDVICMGKHVRAKNRAGMTNVALDTAHT